MLVATGRITKFPIVLVGSAYWNGALGWLKETMLDEGAGRGRAVALASFHQVYDTPRSCQAAFTMPSRAAGVLAPRSGRAPRDPREPLRSLPSVVWGA